jgi:hypothetical protein
VTSEGTTKSVEIPSDDMKGRIIGREGRNIRAFEQATGVDVIIDDTPGVITVNCFDPVRREVAKITMEKLIADGRIHPARIEEIVDLTQKEIENNIRQAGKKAILECNIQGVKMAFAIQAGREIRVIVDPERCDDATAKLIARDIAKRIQAEMTYPGEIRVTVLREVRAVDFAR